MAKILVVEDNEKILKLFKLLIESMGCEVLSAVNGEEGVRTAKEQIPNLILMDVYMPVMNGEEAFKQLQADEATKNIPVIFVTAFALKEDIDYFRSLGIFDCITKPVQKEVLMEAVNKALMEKKN